MRRREEDVWMMIFSLEDGVLYKKHYYRVSRERAQTEEKDSRWLRGIVVVFFFIFQRRLVRARLEQDFLAQTKFQSDASAIRGNGGGTRRFGGGEFERRRQIFRDGSCGVTSELELVYSRQ